MGCDLYHNFAESRAVFLTANSILGFDIARLCFEGPEQELTETVNAQPALFVVSVAALAAVREAGVEAAQAAGHSVGEYAALYAAGAFENLKDALLLVRRRGELMQAAGQEHPGKMAAVLGLAADRVQKAIEVGQRYGIVDAANFNSPAQVVISGEKDAVAKAGEAALALGAKRVVPLKVTGAFHSRRMHKAALKMAEELAKVNIRDPLFPVVANASAQYVRTSAEVRDALARQIAGSVLWEESVRRMVADGIDGFLEIGPGTTLAGLIKRIVPDVPVWSVGDGPSLDAFLEATNR